MRSIIFCWMFLLLVLNVDQVYAGDKKPRDKHHNGQIEDEILPRKPITFRAERLWRAGISELSWGFEVPEDNVFVIEYVSINMTLPEEQKVTQSTIEVRLNDGADSQEFMEFEVPLQLNGTKYYYHDNYIAGMPLRLYAGAGNSLSGRIIKNSNVCPDTEYSFGCGRLVIYLSGYLVPINSVTLSP